MLLLLPLLLFLVLLLLQRRLPGLCPPGSPGSRSDLISWLLSCYASTRAQLQQQQEKHQVCSSKRLCCCCCCTSAAVRRELLLRTDRRGCFPLLAAVQRDNNSELIQQLLQFCRSCMYTAASGSSTRSSSSLWARWVPAWQQQGGESPRMLSQGYQASEV